MVAIRFPLHQRVTSGVFAPPVTLLKPLKGCDAETKRCLQSWFQQQYQGPVQLLLGVAKETDPVCSLVRELLAQYPAINGQLIICAEELGPNGKVSTLSQLEPLIQHDLIVVSDADVEAPPDLLKNLLAPFQRQEVGLANCFYKLGNTVTAAMRWEGIAVNVDFWSQVLQAQSIKRLDFALGAVMATTRRDLRTLGGFSSLVEYLADDYQLGHRIAQNGSLIVLCPVVVECRSAPMGWSSVWKHQLRWARTIRVCQPGPFFFSILSNSTLWPLVWLSLDRTMVALTIAALSWLLRVAMAQFNQRRLTGNSQFWWNCWLVVLKDLLTTVIWLLAFAGNHVEWRGHRYRILPDGRLKEV